MYPEMMEKRSKHSAMHFWRKSGKIELKYAEDGDMDAACVEALKQIEEKDYIARLKQDGMRNFIKYGIACYKKDCKVVIGK